MYLGCTLKDIRIWPGHSNYNFTADTYIHSGIGVREQMAESLSKKLEILFQMYLHMAIKQVDYILILKQKQDRKKGLNK